MILADIDQERLGTIVNERQLSLLMKQATNAKARRPMVEQLGLLESQPK